MMEAKPVRTLRSEGVDAVRWRPRLVSGNPSLHDVTEGMANCQFCVLA